MIVQPIRWDRVQEAIVSNLDSATGKVTSFAYGQGVYSDGFDQDGFVNIEVAVGPSPQDDRRARSTYLLPPTLVDITLSAVTIPELYTMEINGHAFRYESVGGDDEAAILAGLVATTTDETLFSAAVVGSAVQLTPASLGGIWSLLLRGPLDIGPIVLSDDAVRVYRGRSRTILSIGCFSRNGSPRNGAWHLAAQCQAAFESADLVDVLHESEVYVQRVGGGIDLSAESGPSWETRVSFDVEIDTPSTWVRPVDRIETITIGLQDFDPVTINRPGA